eukprot:COSAG01_NODE_3427_length_6093_cov_9.704943_5_plen_50_part_00
MWSGPLCEDRTSGRPFNGRILATTIRLYSTVQLYSCTGYWLRLTKDPKY